MFDKANINFLDEPFKKKTISQKHNTPSLLTVIMINVNAHKLCESFIIDKECILRFKLTLRIEEFEDVLIDLYAG